MTLFRDELDTVFLDVGNTLMMIDHAYLAEGLRGLGVDCAGDELARAEARARVPLSDYLAEGRTSGESAATREYWVREILDALPVTSHAGEVPVKSVLDWLATPEVWSRAWTVVPPFIPDALASLRQAGYRLVAVSNSDGTVEERLVAAGLSRFLDAVIDSGIEGVEKPDPAIFRIALDRVGAQPESSLYVGDIYAIDILGARAAQIQAVLMDPYGDFAAAGVDCPTFPDLAAFAAALR